MMHDDEFKLNYLISFFVVWPGKIYFFYLDTRIDKYNSQWKITRLRNGRIIFRYTSSCIMI